MSGSQKHTSDNANTVVHTTYHYMHWDLMVEYEIHSDTSSYNCQPSWCKSDHNRHFCCHTRQYLHWITVLNHGQPKTKIFYHPDKHPQCIQESSHSSQCQNCILRSHTEDHNTLYIDAPQDQSVWVSIMNPLTYAVDSSSWIVIPITTLLYSMVNCLVSISCVVAKSIPGTT